MSSPKVGREKVAGAISRNKKAGEKIIMGHLFSEDMSSPKVFVENFIYFFPSKFQTQYFCRLATFDADIHFLAKGPSPVLHFVVVLSEIYLQHIRTCICTKSYCGKK